MRQLLPALLVLAFTVYCVVDVVRSDSADVRGLPKPFFVVLCLLFPLAGGIAWLVAGRPRASRLMGTERLGRARPSVLGPDDDPDFLRTIDRPRPVPPAGPLGPGTPAADGAAGPPDEPDRSPGGSSTGAPGPPGAEPDDDGETGPGTPAGTDDRRP